MQSSGIARRSDVSPNPYVTTASLMRTAVFDCQYSSGTEDPAVPDLPQRAVCASGVLFPHRAVDPQRAEKPSGSLFPQGSLTPQSRRICARAILIENTQIDEFRVWSRAIKGPEIQRPGRLRAVPGDETGDVRSLCKNRAGAGSK